MPSYRRLRAKTLRGDMTNAEHRLWSSLRANRLEGLSFRRQSPIGSFVVDFVCHERRLVIEVDGGQHADSRQDVARDRWLQSKGYRVVRFWNSDVMKNRDSVLQSILSAAQIPLPNPPPQGGRERSFFSLASGRGEKGGEAS
ncbi:MAG: DUF559 domain-containing protein [Pseudomonadota bacterium]